MRRSWHSVVLLVATGLLYAGGLAAEESNCTLCHGDEDLFGDDGAHLVAEFAGDIHAAVGLSCIDCHGGNPDPAFADDMDLAMDAAWEPAPYVGAPEPHQVPSFCGRCHSSLEFMRRYRPDASVDQESEYRTSQHGQLLAEGDHGVATCTSCHSHHGIRAVDDPEAPVYPTRIAETCRSCHSDPALMADRESRPGAPLGTDQYGRWRRSVHGQALLDRSDLSAPTCNDCHGNHGAAPPGIDSIAFVCGQCHTREAELFRSSGKHLGFEEHASFMEDAGEDGCVACHDPSEPASSIISPRALTECASCHGSHAVVRPSVAMLDPLPSDPCGYCHGIDGQVLDESEAALQNLDETRGELLAEAEALSLEGERRFDHLVERMLEVDAHRAGSGEASILRPEFLELYERFRIGPTHFSYTGPDGATSEDRIVRCGDCHAAEPLLADSPAGFEASAALSAGSRDLTTKVATAQRILLRARRGGVETRQVLVDLESALDAQTGLAVLVHSFSAAPDGDFAGRQQEGVAKAEAALDHAREAVEELTYRRRGLAVSLVFVVLLLIALTLKIRQIGGD